LVEDDDSIAPRIEEPARACIATAARPTVYEHGRLAVLVTALFVIDSMLAVQRQIALIVGFQRGIERA
jgi:hypothetical protein